MVRIDAKTNEMLGILVVILVDGGWRYIVNPENNTILVYDTASSFVKRFLSRSHVSYRNIEIEDLEQ